MRLLRDPEYREIIAQTFRIGIKGESNTYTDGVDDKGRDVVPLWVKNLGCGFLAIPIVGGDSRNYQKCYC